MGIDADEAEPRFAWAKKSSFSSQLSSGKLDANSFTGRLLGDRTIVAVPSSALFAERIELPPKASLEIVKGQLDVRLPVPVEDCLVLSGFRSNGTASHVMAYAVTRESFGTFLDDFESRFGFQPERVVPEAEALWRKISKSSSLGEGCAVHLHASGSPWTLLAGDGNGLAAMLTVTPGDVASIARNSVILALRLKKTITSFSLSGSKANAKLAEAIQEASSSLSCKVRLVPAPADFLAMALAEEGAVLDLSKEDNFRDGTFPHKASFHRLLSRAVWCGLFLVFLGGLALVFASAEYSRALKRRSAIEEKLTSVAYDLAGRKLPLTGPAALEMARTEFTQRLNPVVENFTDNQAFASIALPLDLALTRNLTFSSIQVDGSLARFSGKALSEDDILLWRRRAKEAGLILAIESQPAGDGVGLHFTATQFHGEGSR